MTTAARWPSARTTASTPPADGLKISSVTPWLTRRITQQPNMTMEGVDSNADSNGTQFAGVHGYSPVYSKSA